MSLDYKQLKILFEKAFGDACRSSYCPDFGKNNDGQYSDIVTEASWFFYAKGATDLEKLREDEYIKAEIHLVPKGGIKALR